MRGWTWIDEDAERSEVEIETLTNRLNALAAEWSSITDAEEQRGFRRQAEIEDGYDYDFEDDAELQDHRRAERERNEAIQMRLEVIEEMMARCGARIMRPYEHWNEDERYMEYMESRYDS